MDFYKFEREVETRRFNLRKTKTKKHQLTGKRRIHNEECKNSENHGSMCTATFECMLGNKCDKFARTACKRRRRAERNFFILYANKYGSYGR